MNQFNRKLSALTAFFFAAVMTAVSQIPEQIEPSGPKAEESFTQSPWLYIAIGGIILLIIFFYAAKKRAERKKREELKDKK